MTSAIDPTKPASPYAYTADQRANWSAAKSEIEALQTAGGTYLPLSGGTMTGEIIVNGPLEAAKFENTAIYASGVIIRPIGQYESAPATGTRANLQSVVNTATTGGKASDTVTYGGLYYTSIYGAPNNYFYSLGSVLSYHSTGGGTGQHTSHMASALRDMAATQPTTTVATTLGAPGNVVAVADVTNLQTPYTMPITINGNPYMQLAVSGATGPGNITVSTTVPVADGTAGNTVMGNNNPPMWGSNIYLINSTGLDSQHTNSDTGIELSMHCNGLDNGGSPLFGSAGGLRTIMNVLGAQQNSAGTAAEIGQGLNVAAISTNFSWKRIIAVGGTFSQSAFDARGATQGASGNAIWLHQGHYLAMDDSGANQASANVRLWSDGTALHSSGALVLPAVSASQITSTAQGGGSASAFVASSPGGTLPSYAWNDASQGADLKWWDALAISGNLNFRAVNDADTAANTWLSVSRTGYVPTTVSLVAATLSMQGALTVGAPGAPNIRSGAGAATGTQPAGSMWLRTDGAAGSRIYVSAGGGTWAAIAGV